MAGDAPALQFEMKAQLCIGNRAAFALEVRPFNERTSGSDSSIDAQSAGTNCAGSDGGKLLQLARRKTAYEIRRAARRFSPEDSRADHQPARSRACRFLHL